MRLSPIPQICCVCLVTTAVVYSQPVWAQQLTQITGVNLRETDSGIEIVITTADGSSPAFVETTDANTLYIDLVDTQLRLPDTGDFQANNPTTNIESVTVAEQLENTVSIIIIGVDSLPNAQIRTDTDGLVVGVNTPPADQPDVTPPTADTEQEIEITVTTQLEPEDSYVDTEVTAGNRVETPILEIPQSVQIITEEVIEDQNINELSDIYRNISGVNPGTVDPLDPGSSFIIRGFGAVGGRENILRNGLRDDTLRFISGITNVERVEVLKGPASVLFGQGTIGGTINIVTKKPLDRPFYQTNFTVGSFDTFRTSIDYTESFNPDKPIAYRLNASYEDQETFKDFEEQEFFFVDLGVALIDNDTTNLTFNVEYEKATETGGAPQLPASGTVVDNPFGEIDISTNLGEPSIAESELRATRLSYELTHELGDRWQIQNQFLAAFQEIPFSTGVVGVGEDGSTELEQIRLSPEDPTLSQVSLRRIIIENPTSNNIATVNTNVVGEFETGSIEHRLILGFEYGYQELDDNLDIRFIGSINVFDPEYRPDSAFPFPINVPDSTTEVNDFGFYLQDQITLTEGLILALGGRYDIANLTFTDSANPDLNSDRTDEAFSPRVGLIYQPEENVSIYASYTRSFLPNAGRSRRVDPISGQAVLGDTFEPEEGRQYEVGVKAELFDQRLLATLAFYDLQRDNVLDQQTLNIEQIGTQKSRGIELDLVGEILPGWNIISTYAYTNAEVVEDNRIAEGNFLPNVPEHAFSLWTTYELQSGDLEGLGFGIGVFFEGEKQGNLENTFTLPGYWRTDAAIFYESDGFKVQLNVQNLFDERYFTSARDGYRVNPGAPLTVLGTVSIEF